MENIGRYKVIAELGRGSSGTVFKAHDSHLDRLVAIKVLSPSQSYETTPQRVVEMFYREGRATARLMHPGIAEIYDVFEDPETGRPCMVMEFVPGGTLTSRLQPEQPLPLTQALDFARQIAEALDYAFSKCLIHRDLKPSNILLGETGRAKITDFGLAEFSGRVGMLMTDSIHGTPAYMAPCRIKGEKYDTRCDIFSLGVILYQMLTGRLPFSGEPSAVLYGILNENPTPPSRLNPDLPVKYDAFIERCLAKDPNERFSSAREFLDRLEELQRTEAIPSLDRFAAVAHSFAALPNTSAEPDGPPKKQAGELAAADSTSSKSGEGSTRKEFTWTIAGMNVRPLPALRVAVVLLSSCAVLGGRVWYESILPVPQALPSTDQGVTGVSLNFSSSSGLGKSPGFQSSNLGQPLSNGNPGDEELGKIFKGPLFSNAMGATDYGLVPPGEARLKDEPNTARGLRTPHTNRDKRAHFGGQAGSSSSGTYPSTFDLLGLNFGRSKSYSSEPGLAANSTSWANEIVNRSPDPFHLSDSTYGTHPVERPVPAAEQSPKRPKFVRVVLGHDLREGELTVAVDGNVVVKEKLKGRRKSFLGVRENYEGVFSRVITLPAHTNVISIDVANSDGTEDLNDVASTDTLESGLHTLHASVKASQLRLTWEPPPQSGSSSASLSSNSTMSAEPGLRASK